VLPIAADVDILLKILIQEQRHDMLCFLNSLCYNSKNLQVHHCLYMLKARFDDDKEYECYDISNFSFGAFGSFKLIYKLQLHYKQNGRMSDS